jgi:hypothetical protein
MPGEGVPSPDAGKAGQLPGGSAEVLLRYLGLVAASHAVYQGALIDAERRIPGLWEMSLEEVARRGAENPPTRFTFPPGKDVVAIPHGGFAVVDVEPEA